MSQFGNGPKPPGWGSRAGQQQIPTSTVFPGQFGSGPNHFGMSNPMGMIQGLGSLVNTAAFQGGPAVGMLQQAHNVQQQIHANAARVQAIQQQQAAAVPAAAKNQRTFVGVVTKMHDNYGFVDDDVFFQQNVVRGATPRVGDRVMVEATFNQAMPFKWNALRVQLLPENAMQSVPQQQPPQQQVRQAPAPLPVPAVQQSSGGGGGGGSRWGPSSAETRPQQRMPSPPRRRPSPPRRATPPPRRASPPRRPSPPSRRRSITPRRPASRRPSPRRASPPRRHENLKRERSPAVSTPKASTPALGHKKESSASPPRRRARIIPRYVCNTLKPIFHGSKICQSTLKKRFTHLYIPSDFTQVDIDWMDSIPIEAPLDLSQAVAYHIFHKDVDIPESELELFDTSDADHKHQVKVLLLAHPERAALEQKTWGLLPDGSTDDTFEPVSLLKNIHLLVGSRGKEQLAIGGAWCASQDGADPTALSTLIKTAVRTTRTLTGIDLSNVAAWYPLAQVRYFRADKQRVDRVTLLLPDTAGIVPDTESCALLDAALRDQLAAKLAAIDAEKEAAEKQEQEGSRVPEKERVAAALLAAEEEKKAAAEQEAKLAAAIKKESEEAAELAAAEKAAAAAAAGVEEGAAGVEAVVPIGEDGTAVAATTTHWSKLDVKALKVAELKTELEGRGLETKGIKTLLAQRLQDALEREKKEEEEKHREATGGKKEEKVEEVKVEPETPEKTEAEKTKEEAEKKKALEKAEKDRKERKAALEKHYNMPKDPRVLVFPSKTAKSGKFDCKVVSLHSLLEYRQEDNKESQFEVALYAECLRDVLERTFSFRVYAALAQSGDREAEKKRREEARKEREHSETSKDEDKKEDKEKKEEDKKVELRSVIVHRDIFDAFAYFDQNLCGYLMERDLEEIISHVEIGIPRGLVAKYAKKLSTRDKINYRHLTDSLVDVDGETRYTPGVCDGASSIQELAKGFGSRWTVAGEEAEAKLPLSFSAGDGESPSGLVTIDGCIVNVRQKLIQLKKFEAEKEAAVGKLKEIETSLKNLKEVKDALDKKKKRAEEDSEKYKKRVHEAEKNVKTCQDETLGLRNAVIELKKLGEKMVATADKSLPPPPKKKKEEEPKKDEKLPEKMKTASENGTKEDEEEPMVIDGDIILSDQVGDDDVKKDQEHQDSADHEMPEAVESEQAEEGMQLEESAEKHMEEETKPAE